MRPLLVGDTDDPHICAIARVLRAAGVEPEFLDNAAHIGSYPLGKPRPASSQNERVRRRGIIRSLPTYPSTLLPAELHAWSEFIDGVLYTLDVDWLSSLAAIRQADSKLYQLYLAQQAGVALPKLLVPQTVSAVRKFLGARAVLKPLGSGIVTDDDNALRERVFYSTLVNVSELSDGELARAPVLAQEPVQAIRHIRIVTVQQKAWSASLDAPTVAFDWRESPASQLTWQPCTPPEDVVEHALRLTALARIGFSSQDWLETSSCHWFLDLNPVGKWLFLPASIADAITEAVAAWLSSQCDDS